MLGNIFDVITIAETKLDDSFPTNQFHLEGFCKPYRLDVSANSGGLLTYIRSDIPSRQLTSFCFQSDVQAIFVELNFHKQKWLLCNIYRPPKQNLQSFLSNISDALDFYSEYENVLIRGHFNVDTSNVLLSEFMISQSLYSHLKEKNVLEVCKWHLH